MVSVGVCLWTRELCIITVGGNVCKQIVELPLWRERFFSDGTNDLFLLLFVVSVD